MWYDSFEYAKSDRTPNKTPSCNRSQSLNESFSTKIFSLAIVSCKQVQRFAIRNFLINFDISNVLRCEEKWFSVDGIPAGFLLGADAVVSIRKKCIKQRNTYDEWKAVSCDEKSDARQWPDLFVHLHGLIDLPGRWSPLNVLCARISLREETHAARLAKSMVYQCCWRLKYVDRSSSACKFFHTNSRAPTFDYAVAWRNRKAHYALASYHT